MVTASFLTYSLCQYLKDIFGISFDFVANKVSKVKYTISTNCVFVADAEFNVEISVYNVEISILNVTYHHT